MPISETCRNLKVFVICNNEYNFYLFIRKNKLYFKRLKTLTYFLPIKINGNDKMHPFPNVIV